MLLHSRFGHPSFRYLKHLFPTLFKGVSLSDFKCDACHFAKDHRTVFPLRGYTPSKPFYLIHSDVWGPSKIPTMSGKKWFVTFIDDHTRMSWLYFFTNKSEVDSIFQQFHCMIYTQFGVKISILRTDNGTEYFKASLSSFLNSHGIIHQSSCPYTPQQNGIAERKNRHLLEVARALMFSKNVPKYLWGDAVLTAAYLINRLPSKVLNFQTPIQVFKTCFPHQRLLNELPLKVFGCTVFVLLPQQSRTKIEPRSRKCIFLGYAAQQKGYKCLDPQNNRIFITVNTVFWEAQPFYDPSLQGEKSDGFEISTSTNFWETELENTLPIVVPESRNNDMNNSKTEGEVQETVLPKPNTNSNLQVYTRRRKGTGGARPISVSPAADHPNDSSNDDLDAMVEQNPTAQTSSTIEPSQGKSQPPDPNSDLEFPIALRKGTRACTRHPISNYMSYANLSKSYKTFVSRVTNQFVPKNIKEAMSDVNWNLAVKEEMQALVENDTWTVTELPQGKNTVGCKWVFTVKYLADGSVDRYKARLVARGFTQTYGLDYTETFAPVAKINSIRILLSVAVNMNWSLHQLDVKNAFLNGVLDEEVFMTLPPGYEEVMGSGKVCRLKKSLYGLKQSPRAWFERFGAAVKQFGFSQSQADHTLFISHLPNNKIVILIVYVDDIIVTGNDEAGIKEIKMKLATEFEIKDLGVLRYFLGLEFARAREGLFVSQRKYVLDLLEETGMSGCRPAGTPMDFSTKLRPSDESEVKDRERYQRLVGRLIYLAHTRPDITYAVSVVSQFMHAPGAMHFDAVYRILRYLKGSPGKGLMFKKRDSLQVEAYTDADWAGDPNDRKSTSGYCTFLGGNLISWRSKKQSVVARSSAEAEFRAMSLGICEVIWIKRLLDELKLVTPTPIRLYCDNKSAVAIAHNPVLHDRTKHVEIDKHFIKEKLDSGLICMPYIATTNQIADIFTKSLYKGQFNYLVNKLAMEDIFQPA
ncbi:Retrovirus-related Pol polyprotein from transposon TNT 1-94 [Linum perenne]